MINFFTYYFTHNNDASAKPKRLDNTLYEPSEKSVKTVLDFARAYHPAKLKSCEENDILLN